MIAQNEVELIHVKESNRFIGIKINNSKIEVHVPQIFHKNVDEKVYHRDLLKFLKSLSLVTAMSEDIQISDNELVGEMWPIESYLWMINDFFENGYYFNREKKYYHDNKGKIDWKRTLRTTPIYSNGNIIYDKLITSRVSASDDKIAQIYKICLSISLKRIGWIYNLNFKVDVQQHMSNQIMIYNIQKELESTFDDVKRLRFRHMLKVIRDIKRDNALSNKSTFGITNYYYVVERMIDKIFKGISAKQLKVYNPYGWWEVEGKKTKASLLRPDTIYEQNDNIYIIDSKMYKYGYTAKKSDLPQTSSILKQIAYGDFVKKMHPGKNVRNVFIIPYDKELNEFKLLNKSKVLEYIGKASGEWNVNDVEHNSIYTYVIDYMYLLMNYNNPNNTLIDELCSSIEEYISKK
ncbi:LlaJI family restriction endonuclease [Thomasclavelia cocleata]|uniref:LlaJI restriction endonuclease n=1 Tax=Thomasclavelia cocleata TaxID=69824 RepID=A0A1I0EH96_9FIRM|nr:LlaJI family restriction endonuclease [Thomasclavelia cocleata]MCR1959335.1 LlaJI family restriction endonuclease [Thomasclavelia cocleata]NDO42363.1 LlaJI family restriction endonuclease [Thomasclavelia cocleata]PJN81011.1 LlaJI family restriction endonuclease [Thomasclavelia cocleata]SET44538.1 LlaJI restriction endonuclease [Thomasclavelia cocleata]